LLLSYSVLDVSNANAALDSGSTSIQIDQNDLVVIDQTQADLNPTVFEGADGGADDSTIATGGMATGSFIFTDADINDSHSVGVEVPPATYFGAFSVGLSDPAAGDGQGEVTWTFDVPSGTTAVDELPAGATITQTYNVTITDSSGGEVTQAIAVTITGTNDVPTITASMSEDTAVIEDGGVLNGTAGDDSASGTLTIVDVDTGESSFQAPAPTSLSGTYGNFTFDNATGVWSYELVDARPATEALDAGDSDTDTLTVTSLDGTETYDIVVTVTGSNDSAVVSGADTGAVTEAGGVANATAGTRHTGAG